MTVPKDFTEAKERVTNLVEAFRKNEATFTSSTGRYNETQARTEFISPFLEALGWDVYNQKQMPLDLREVFEEATVEVGEERAAKKPDYELRLARQRKLFVEAKKPSVDIGREKAPAFQTRRYGFSASLPISVLTNFRALSIYDCIPSPNEEHEANIARIVSIPYSEYVDRFDEIYGLLSRHSVYSGAFDEEFKVEVSRRGSEQFDGIFLSQVRTWRRRLAADLHSRNPRLSAQELTFVVQRFLSRLVFLRICEDREIEKYGTLRDLKNEGAFESLTSLLVKADKFYDSGLFRVLDDRPFEASFTDEDLQEILNELYYPMSPYTFSVVEASVLGEIYELFLSEVIEFAPDGSIEIVEKPEVRESGGVYTTPRFVVDAIVERTLHPLVEGRAPNEYEQLTVADICCGSGVFLLGAFEYLLGRVLEWYVQNRERVPDPEAAIYEVVAGQWRLTFAMKRKLLLRHIRGVDIDSNAVEVAKFSLCLRLLEGETKESLATYLRDAGGVVLPDLDGIIKSGNSLITHAEIESDDRFRSTSDDFFPFTWSEEFAEPFAAGGFDAIVGNPPYIRIQKMVAYSPDEVLFFQGDASPYQSAADDNFDKYALFIERSLQLTRPGGRVGLIIPNKFMTTRSGKAVRGLLTATQNLAGLTDFGSLQVFGADVSNYTCIVDLERASNDRVRLEQVGNLTAWRYGERGVVNEKGASDFGEEPWRITSDDASEVFDRVIAERSDRLEDVADIFVGVQTSKDDVFIVEATRETADGIEIEWDGRTCVLEKAGLRPFLRDVQLTAYEPPVANRFAVFPYEITGGRATLIQPDRLQSEMPGIWDYFKARQAELEDRAINGGRASERQFYQYGRSQSLIKFDSPKIILPILSLEPRYSFDDRNIVVTGGGNGPYYLIRPKDSDLNSLRFHLAVLCHPLSEALVRTKTSFFRGGYYSHGKQFIKDLPIPNATTAQRDAVAKNVEKIVGLFTELRSLKIPAERTRKLRGINQLKAEIEGQITKLFKLSASDLATIA